MIKHRLIIPNNGNPLEWYELINNNNNPSSEIKTLIVDFNIIAKLETDDLVVLACLIELYYIKECIIEFVGGSAIFNKYIISINFKGYWDKNSNREDITRSTNKTTLGLWKISQSMIDSYASHAKKYFTNSYLENKDLIPIASNLLEIFNNIFDHSNSKVSGFIITQYYPETNNLSFSVCDFGIGIPKSINDYRKKKYKTPLDDHEAIYKAISEGYSAQSTPHNRGLGLNNISEFVKAADGSLVITSNNGSLIYKADSVILIKEEINFYGTLIKVSIDTKNLEDYDINEEIYEL